MTDGPFRNTKLSNCWKRFGDALDNEASSEEDRSNLALHAVVHEILCPSTQRLIVSLNEKTSHPQSELDPNSAIESEFEKAGKTLFTDTLQKEMSYRLDDGSTPCDALRDASEASVRAHINEAKNRLEEECIRAQEGGDIRKERASRISLEAANILRTLPVDRIRDAVLSGDRNAFRDAASKKRNIDEGPGL